MKRNVFVYAMAVAALAGCSKTETVDQSPVGAIRFDGAHISYPTESRSVTELDQSITEFQVFGQYTKGSEPVKVFDNETVTKGGGGGWTYTGGLRPWIEGAQYVFAAYAPADALTSPQVNEAGYLTLTDYSVAGNQKDLIYAAKIATGQAAGSNTAVQFSFKHLLSIVGVTFKSGFGEDTELTVSEVKVNKVPSKATFTASGETGSDQLGGTWGAASDPQSFGLTIAGITEPEGTSADNIVVIPQTIPTGDNAVEIAFKVTVTTAAGEELVPGKEFTSKIPVATITTWDPGFKYNYVATITPESVELDYIEFSDPVVDTWKPAEDGDQDLPLQ